MNAYQLLTMQQRHFPLLYDLYPLNNDHELKEYARTLAMDVNNLGSVLRNAGFLSMPGVGQTRNNNSHETNGNTPNSNNQASSDSTHPQQPPIPESPTPQERLAHCLIVGGTDAICVSSHILCYSIGIGLAHQVARREGNESVLQIDNRMGFRGALHRLEGVAESRPAEVTVMFRECVAKIQWLADALNRRNGASATVPANAAFYVQKRRQPQPNDQEQSRKKLLKRLGPASMHAPQVRSLPNSPALSADHAVHWPRPPTKMNVSRTPGQKHEVIQIDDSPTNNGTESMPARNGATPKTAPPTRTKFVQEDGVPKRGKPSNGQTSQAAASPTPGAAVSEDGEIRDTDESNDATGESVEPPTDEEILELAGGTD